MEFCEGLAPGLATLGWLQLGEWKMCGSAGLGKRGDLLNQGSSQSRRGVVRLACCGVRACRPRSCAERADGAPVWLADAVFWTGGEEGIGAEVGAVGVVWAPGVGRGFHGRRAADACTSRIRVDEVHRGLRGTCRGPGVGPEESDSAGTKRCDCRRRHGSPGCRRLETRRG